MKISNPNILKMTRDPEDSWISADTGKLVLLPYGCKRVVILRFWAAPPGEYWEFKKIIFQIVVFCTHLLTC